MQLIRRFQDTVFYSIEASVPLVMIWPYLGLLSFIPCAILIGMLEHNNCINSLMLISACLVYDRCLQVGQYPH